MKKEVALAASVLLLIAATSEAANVVVDIGGGWEAVWDGTLYPSVDVSGTLVDDAVFIQKSAEVHQGPVGGVFPSIPITFRQTQAAAAEYIVIDDEILTNSTGYDWTDFHFILLDGPDAVFDPTKTASSGGGLPIGFYIAPFTEAEFAVDLKRLDIWEGTLLDGETWYPGDGASNGQLWIDVTPMAIEPFTVFRLKETPTPEPATVALLGLGALAILARKRK